MFWFYTNNCLSNINIKYLLIHNFDYNILFINTLQKNTIKI